MNLVQAPPGAVPFVPLGSYTRLQVQTFTAVNVRTLEAYRKRDLNLLPTSKDIAVEVAHNSGASVDEVIKTIEELRGDSTLLMLPDGRLLYCSDE